jgi:hypothetical protein
MQFRTDSLQKNYHNPSSKIPDLSFVLGSEYKIADAV